MKPPEKPLPADIAKNWMTTEEAKAAIGVEKTALYNLCDRGLVRRKKWLGRALFSRDSIATLIGRGSAR